MDTRIDQQMHRSMDLIRWTDRWIDRFKDRQTDRQIDRQIDKWIGRQIGGYKWVDKERGIFRVYCTYDK